MADKPKRQYIEVAGDWELSDQKLASKLRDTFIKTATAEGNKGKIWITRSAGMERSVKGKKSLHLWSKGDKSLQHTGGRKTWEEYKEADNKIKARHRQWAKGPRTDIEPPRSIQATDKPHLRKPRTTLGSVINFAANEYNKNLEASARRSGKTQDQINKIVAEGRINVQPETISDLRSQFRGTDTTFSDLKKVRESNIESRGAQQKAFFTRSGTLETRGEKHAREMYDRVASYLKETGQAKKTSPTKTRDFYIDAVNAKKFKNPTVAKEFREGAFKFLTNKELDLQYKNPDVPYLTTDAHEAMKGWNPGSVITSTKITIPNYAEIPGKTETVYTGNTLIDTVTGSGGPELPEHVVMGSGDHAVHVDRMSERYGSSHFAEQLDEEGKRIQQFSNPAVEEPLSTWQDELGDVKESTIKKTVTAKTKGGTWGWENQTNATLWEGYPGRTHTAVQGDTGVTPSQWVNTLDVAETPKTALTTNLLAAQTFAYGLPDKHSATKDAVKEFLKPTKEFDATTGEKVGGVAPSIDTEEFSDRESILIEQDMDNIEQSAKKNWKTQITSYTAGKEGQTVHVDNSIKPIREIRTNVMGEHGTLSVVAVKPKNQGTYTPTFEERKQMAEFKHVTQSNRAGWDKQVNRKIDEWKKRGKKPYVSPPAKKGETIAILKKGETQSVKTKNFLEWEPPKSTSTINEQPSLRDANPQMTADELGLPKDHGLIDIYDDHPGDVYEGGMSPTAHELGIDTDALKAHNARVDAKTKSKTSTKVPSVKGVTKAILPAVGALGILAIPATAEAALWGRNPSAATRAKQYMREFFANPKVAGGIDEPPGYLNNLGIFGNYDPKKLREWGKRRTPKLTGKGNASIINMLKPSTENAWKNRKRARRN